MSERRAWRYEVTDVAGDMVGRLEQGETIIDYWHGESHTYTIMNMRTREESGSFSVKLLGEHDKSWDAILAARKVSREAVAGRGDTP